MRSIATFAAIFLTFAGTADATVCRRPGLDGYEQAAIRAKEYLPPETNNISEMAVYIERDPYGSYYFHSNFKSEGADYVTKIGGEPQLKDLETALLNVVFTSWPSPGEHAALKRAMMNDIKIYVSHDIFEGDGSTNLDFKGRKQVVIVDHEARTSTGGLIVSTDSPPPFGAQRIDGCCVNGRPPGKRANSLQAMLLNSKIQPNNVQLISLVADTATAAAITNTASLRNIAVAQTSGRSFSMSEIDAIFKKSEGKDIVILGHVEKGEFVTRDAAGQIISKVSISELRSSARRHNVLLVEVGCNTAGVVASQVTGAAVATRFNTVDAVNRLAKALAGSINLKEFFNKLADENLQIVVDARTIEARKEYHAAIYEAKKGPSPQTQVGEVVITARKAGILETWLPTWLK